MYQTMNFDSAPAFAVNDQADIRTLDSGELDDVSGGLWPLVGVAVGIGIVYLTRNR